MTSKFTILIKFSRHVSAVSTKIKSEVLYTEVGKKQNAQIQNIYIHAITNDEPVYWRIYASLALNVLKCNAWQ